MQAKTLPNSGRSTPSIIRLANYLIDWTQSEHPVEQVRDALQPPRIEPTPPGDPQPNPPDASGRVRLIMEKYAPAEELQAVVRSIAHWLPQHPEETVAVLVPRNERGFAVSEELKRQGMEYIEMLRSTASTRQAAGVLGNIVNYLAEPASATKLASAYRAWRHADREIKGAKPRLERVARVLRRCSQVEDYLWPRLEIDWLDAVEDEEDVPGVREELAAFKAVCRRWQGATLLPIDQLILTLAQDLFHEPADLAIAYKLALVLQQAAESHPEWRLPELTQELATVARNERRFLGLSQDDMGFDPDKYPGKVVVTTIHKAKGLEWDQGLSDVGQQLRLSIGPAHDTYISERWFIRDHLNLEAEALAQLKALASHGSAMLEMDDAYVEGRATEQARYDYAAERLRLLYVAITRAKRDLIITWNTGRGNPSQQPSCP